VSNKDLVTGTEVLVGSEKVEIRPLTIRQLRRFVKIVGDLDFTDQTELSDEDIDNMIDAAAIALEKAAPELAKDKDNLEDLLDIRTFNAILNAAMGVDPNV
jgi:hypothetical protein